MLTPQATILSAKEKKRKSGLIYSIGYVGIFFLFLLGGISFVERDFILGSLDLTMALLMGGAIIYSKKSGNLSGAINFSVYTIAIFFMYLFATGGINNSASLWYFTFPLISFFMLGSRRGFWANTVLFVFAILVFLTDDQVVGFTVYQLDFKIRFIPSFLVVSAFSYIYESYREKNERELQSEVETRMSELVGANSQLKLEIDERKKIEKKLFRANQRLIRVMNSFDAMVVVIDLESLEVLFVNHYGKETYGDITGQICWQSMHKGMQGPCSFCPNKGLVEVQEKPFASLVWELQSSINGRWYENRDRPIDWIDGRQVKIQITTDITEQKLAEQELLKVKKLESVGLLAGGIAHDFNNILAAILGNINLALFDNTLKDGTKNLLAEAEKASLRAKDLTQQLLTFSKGGEPIKEVTALENIIKDAANFVIHSDRVSCRFHIPDNLWLVDIDKEQICQVIQNVVLNGSQAMPAGGLINISCENIVSGQDDALPAGKNGKFVKISIHDSGVGIPPNVVEKVFDPYFSTKQEGTGLGLAITQSIINKHDGYISLESYSGVGSTFAIYLRASEKTGTKPRESFEINQVEAQGRILIMDDEEMVRSVCKMMLAQMGHEVALSKNGEEALELYQEAAQNANKFDLVIMDLTIPGGMGGKEAVKRILAINPGAKVIVSSGYSNDPVMASCKEYGFCSAIVKPYRLKELAKVINQVLVDRLVD